MTNSAKLIASLTISIAGTSILALLALGFGFGPLGTGITYCLSGTVILLFSALSLPTCSEQDA
jgi:hypothetical protein